MSVQKVLVCQPSAFPQAPCPSGQGIFLVDSYLLDPAQSSVYETLVEPFSTEIAGQFFLFGLVTVLSFWLLGIAIGIFVNFIKRA